MVCCTYPFYLSTNRKTENRYFLFFPLLADDFEVIPHIRSVIALDDVAIIHDMDLDEPWEHIYDSGEGKASDVVNKFGRLTYARVAGTGCQ